MHSESVIRSLVGISFASVVSTLTFVGTVLFIVSSVLLCAVLVSFVAICAIIDQSLHVSKMVYHEMRWGPEGK